MPAGAPSCGSSVSAHTIASLPLSMRSIGTTTSKIPGVCGRQVRDIRQQRLALDFPERLFQPVVPAGTRLGPLLPEIAAETGLGRLSVVASCSHDTGAAVAGVPAETWQLGPWAYLSSGTWSLMGVELPQPLLSSRCRDLNFTNELGYGNSVRLLKNLVGLWMVQECRREWEGQGKNYAYNDLTELAARAPPASALVNPADERFLSAAQ